MFLLDKLLTFGLRFVLDKIAQVADQELFDEARLRKILLDAHMRFELGEISEEELKEVEAEIFPRLRALEEERRARAEAVMEGRVTGVEIELEGERHEREG